MKKSVLFLALAAAAMTGCSQSEVVEQASDAQTGRIGFSTHVNKGTRAIDNDNFSQFTVFGSYTQSGSANRTVVFSDVKVKKEADGWSYGTGSDLRYWIEGATYNFAGYAIDGNTLPGGASANYRDNQYLNITNFLANGDNQYDLVYAAPAAITAKAEGNSAVAMEFKHALSRIMLRFKNSFPAGYTIEIQNAKVVNVRDKGNFYGSVFETKVGNPWVKEDGAYKEPFRSTTTPEIPMGIKETEKAAVDTYLTTEEAYVIPFKYEQANVKVQFHLYVYRPDGEKAFDNIYTATMPIPNWEMSHQYRYTLDLTGSAAGLQPIEFTASVGDWDAITELEFDKIDAGVVDPVVEG